MKLTKLRTVTATTLAILGLGLAQSASAIIVSGVDFGTPGTSHLETTTIAETLITGDGQELRGYGQVNTVNGNLLYGVNPLSRLYFVFDGYTSQNFVGGATPSAEFTGGEIRVYLSPTTFNLLSADSATNFTNIDTISVTPWLTLRGHDLDGAGPGTATLAATGPNISFTGAGFLDVILASSDPSVGAFMDSNGLFDRSGVTKTDIEFTSSGAFSVVNPNDTCNLQAGEWCIQGSADLRGLTVPEPSVLALLGLGLMGAGFSSRKRKAKQA